ncbi:tyrosine-protein phosphatase non-receptor type 1-like [Arapaima gigas]
MNLVAGSTAWSAAMEAEFQEIDERGSWNDIYQEIREQSIELPCQIARLPENKARNRYRDVSPFDDSRIRLQLGSNNYINASLISMEETGRSYILTQGPLPNTCGHFWEMVWEQRSSGVVMLNRVIEKGSVKCAQYWPSGGEREMVFEDTNFKLTLVSEDVKSYYTVRWLELENLSTQESREVLHFHYTTWPDFGVPESPASFLNFLFRVRESGCLALDKGPAVVHCSAGIGRSGTFCLVDTCLLLMSLREDPSSVRLRDVLLHMRRYRMGLIQTPDQLRFSYLAVIEGARFTSGDTSVQESWKELSKEEDPPPEFTPPPPRPPKRSGVDSHNGRVAAFLFSVPTARLDDEHIVRQHNSFHIPSEFPETELRRRAVGDAADGVADPAQAEGLPTGVASPDSGDATKEAQGGRKELSSGEDGTRVQQQDVADRVMGDIGSLAGRWSPLLVVVCSGSLLALGVYFYCRAAFH